MKIARFENLDGKIVYGIIDESGNEAELISGNIFGKFKRTGKKTAVLKLLSPVDPPNVIAIGLNYRDHAEETGMPIPTQPIIFIKLTTSVIGPNEAIVLPKVAPNTVDYEAELAIVIGKKAKDVEEADAEQYILGYTCGNDLSERDCQLKIDKQWARGKSFDTFCPLGPWIVTPDELDPSDLAIQTFVNGQRLQNSRTSRLIFSVKTLVSYLSKQFTLLPGTVIMTGTPPGVGFSYKPEKYLKAGDEVVVEIEKIGRLKNKVV
jgi:2-keto-4-pentenoate hydratase/2-oxohepta-3-ene-1,7-dioic acid hydratase in catechol pathway